MVDSKEKLEYPFYEPKKGVSEVVGFKEVNVILGEVVESANASLRAYYQEREDNPDLQPSSFDNAMLNGLGQLREVVPLLEDSMKGLVLRCIERVGDEKRYPFYGFTLESVVLEAMGNLSKGLADLVKKEPSLGEGALGDEFSIYHGFASLKNRIEGIQESIRWQEIRKEQAAKVTKACWQCQSPNTACYGEKEENRGVYIDEYTFYCLDCGCIERKGEFAGSLYGFDIGLSVPYATLCPYCGKSSKLSEHPKPPADLPIRKESFSTNREGEDLIASAQLECGRHPVDCGTCSLSENCPLHDLSPFS